MGIDKIVRRMKKQGRATTQSTGPLLDLPASWELPFPPSTNKLWHNVTDDTTGVTKRVLTKEARAFKRAVGAKIRGRVADGQRFTLTLNVFFSCYTKKGTVRQIDLTNRVKILEDAVAAALGYDDSRNWRVVLQKRDTQGPRFVRATLDTYRPQKEPA